MKAISESNRDQVTSNRVARTTSTYDMNDSPLVILQTMFGADVPVTALLTNILNLVRKDGFYVSQIKLLWQHPIQSSCCPAGGRKDHEVATKFATEQEIEIRYLRLLSHRLSATVLLELKAGDTVIVAGYSTKSVNVQRGVVHA